MLFRLVLVWFVLTLGAAVAAPVLQPKTMTLVCSEAGNRVVVLDADGATVPDAMPGASHTLDCPLCLPAAPPPPQPRALPTPAQPVAGAVPPVVSAIVAALIGAPLPARGPPSLS